MSAANDTMARPGKRARLDEKKIDRCSSLYKQARRLWLQGGDLKRVESLLKKIIPKNYVKSMTSADDRESSKSLIAGTNQTIISDHSANLNNDGNTKAASDQAIDAMALLYAQSDDLLKRKSAVELMRSKGYIARLSSEILCYNSGSVPVMMGEKTLPTKGSNRTDTPSAAELHTNQENLYCLPLRVIDDALPPACLMALQKNFCSDHCDYWTSHSYSVDPPSPYFSYVTSLGGKSCDGPLMKLINIVKAHAEANFDGVEVARFAEVWAHRRPHCSGHQLHFDSDNEGVGGAASIRNPLVSAVCYLTEEGVGGPTLVTDQCLGDRGLARNGWLAFPKLNRLVIFDGQVLHGVIPGRGQVMPLQSQRKRVTIMVALWEDIRIRRGIEPGAARPLPSVTAKSAPKWALNLLSGDDGDIGCNDEESFQEDVLEKQLTAPTQVSHVWTTLDDEPLNESETIHYDRVFQGF